MSTGGARPADCGRNERRRSQRGRRSSRAIEQNPRSISNKKLRLPVSSPNEKMRSRFATKQVHWKSGQKRIHGVCEKHEKHEKQLARTRIINVYTTQRLYFIDFFFHSKHISYDTTWFFNWLDFNTISRKCDNFLIIMLLLIKLIKAHSKRWFMSVFISRELYLSFNSISLLWIQKITHQNPLWKYLALKQIVQ